MGVGIWLSTTIVLLAAELNAELERQTAEDTTPGPAAPRWAADGGGRSGHGCALPVRRSADLVVSRRPPCAPARGFVTMGRLRPRARRLAEWTRVRAASEEFPPYAHRPGL